MDYPTFLKSIQKHLAAISDNIVNDEERVGNMRAAWTIGRDVTGATPQVAAAAAIDTVVIL